MDIRKLFRCHDTRPSNRIYHREHPRKLATIMLGRNTFYLFLQAFDICLWFNLQKMLLIFGKTFMILSSNNDKLIYINRFLIRNTFYFHPGNMPSWFEYNIKTTYFWNYLNDCRLPKTELTLKWRTNVSTLNRIRQNACVVIVTSLLTDVASLPDT